jgi:hypothetical protein
VFSKQILPDLPEDGKDGSEIWFFLQFFLDPMRECAKIPPRSGRFWHPLVAP